MATKLLKYLTILSLVLALLHSQMSVSSSSAAILEEEDDDQDDQEYILDEPFANAHLRSRFLASIKKGTSCQKENKCNGVYADKGTSLLYCCKTHCRNVLGDRNNCGSCGIKCKFGEKCCGGRCINVMFDPLNCGKCGGKCKQGLKCGYGYCGYA